MRLSLCGLVLTTCVTLWAWHGDLTGSIATHLLLYGAAFVAYLVALHAGRDLAPRGLRWALCLAVLWRGLLVLAPPLLSDDVYRSVWEGRIQLHGGNPYAWPDRPEAPRWLGLRDRTWEAMNHKDHTAIYPPLWQITVCAIVFVWDSVTFMKAFLVGCELLSLFALARLLRRMGLPRERLLVWAWSPLALVEIAGSGHNEPLGMLFLVLALASLDGGKALLAALAAALGAQAKLLPGLIAVAWARRFRVAHVLTGVVLLVLLVLPYRDAGAGLFMSLGKYGQQWRFNETLFAAIAVAAGDHARAVAIAVLLLVLLAVLLAWRLSDPITASLAIVVATLVLSPNVLPWYALWLLPLLVLRHSPPALLFSGTVSLAYLVYPSWQSGEVWRIGWGIRLLEYGPCVAVAGLCWRESLAKRGGVLASRAVS